MKYLIFRVKIIDYFFCCDIIVNINYIKNKSFTSLSSYDEIKEVQVASYRGDEEI